jgi:hypothetical protein
MNGPHKPRWPSRLPAVGGGLGLVALAATLIAALAHYPGRAVGLLLCLPLWAVLYAGSALLY